MSKVYQLFTTNKGGLILEGILISARSSIRYTIKPMTVHWLDHLNFSFQNLNFQSPSHSTQQIHTLFDEQKEVSNCGKIWMAKLVNNHLVNEIKDLSN